MNSKNTLMIAITVMAVLTILLVVTVIGLQMKLDEVNGSLVKTRETFITEVDNSKQQIKKGLEEKYRADMVSYEAMAKRAAIETAKRKELENKLKEGQS
ncbi:MAG: hypothetical protein HQL29_04270 [Candidatus Omnitrophica bacterium]|nr:hypothetical protein [Candidatus Omnitrophota bacterium]